MPKSPEVVSGRWRFAPTSRGNVRVPPQRRMRFVEVVKNDRTTGWSVDLQDTRDRSCSLHKYAKDCGCGTANSYYAGEPQTEDPRLAALVTYVTDVVHEGLEWITLDGEEFASAHPKQGQVTAMFWWEDHLVKLFEEYKRWAK